MNELALLDAMQASLRSPGLDAAFAMVAAITTGGALWLAVGAILAALPRHRRAGIAVLVSVLAASVLAKLVLGELFQRPRPCDAAPWVALAVDRPFGWSFPSGHAATAFAAVAAMATSRVPEKLPRPLVAAFGVAALVVAFSRLYLYVHYPSDVVVGAVLGAAVGWVVAKAMDAWPWRRKPSEANS